MRSYYYSCVTIAGTQEMFLEVAKLRVNIKKKKDMYFIFTFLSVSGVVS